MLERISDPIDHGSHLAEAEREHLTALQRNRATPKQVQQPDGTWPVTECEECGEHIPVARLRAVGAVTCIHCETEKEEERKYYGQR